MKKIRRRHPHSYRPPPLARGASMDLTLSLGMYVHSATT